MIKQTQGTEPKLASPGAGIPLPELIIAKYFIFPRIFKSVTVEQAIENFERESRKIVELARALDDEQLVERRLIPRLRGLEDSSRYYSVAMTLEHLVIVGHRTQVIIENLSAGIVNMPAASTAAVKPPEAVNAQSIILDFERMTSSWCHAARAADLRKFPDARFAHPWFGPLSAEKWIKFAAPHQNLHRRQIKEIIKRLG